MVEPRVVRHHMLQKFGKELLKMQGKMSMRISRESINQYCLLFLFVEQIGAFSYSDECFM